MKEVEKWIGKAEKDLEDAKFNFEGKRFEVSSFLSHQAAEKALKALYILKFKRLWKVHDLKELASRLKALQQSLSLVMH
jgi:HEPN domain-containing protein